MKDIEFKQLKKDIEQAMNELRRLQKVYANETGVDYRMPLYLSAATLNNAGRGKWR